MGLEQEVKVKTIRAQAESVRQARTFMNLAEYIDGRRDQNLAELNDFLRIPSVSAESEHKPDVERAARWVADNLRSAGFSTIEVVPTAMSDDFEVAIAEGATIVRIGSAIFGNRDAGERANA